METSTTTTVLLTAQELRNAIYTGSWLTDAKRYFSKNGCVAYKTANKYLNGEMNRQAYLERAIKWIAAREGSQYLSSDYKTDERNFEYNENVLYLSTEAAIIKIVELLRKESITSIDKFIEFSNWYADHFLISESVMFTLPLYLQMLNT